VAVSLIIVKIKYFFQFDTKKKQFKEYDKNLKSIGKKVKKKGAFDA
jgi:hypothetical protein